jgi:hypothetical protein
MDLNTISLSVFGCMLLYGAYLYWKNYPRTPIEKSRITPWGEQVGRSKLIQSKNGDASMATEMTRRRTIQVKGKQDPSAIKERTHGKGSGTGAIETFFLTSICPPVCLPIIEIINKICEPYDIIFDGGNIYSEFCPVLDDQDGEIVYDAGGIDTIVCGE